MNELEGVVGNHSPTGKVAGGRQTAATLAELLGRERYATLAVSLYQRTSIIKSIVFNFRLLATPNHNQTKGDQSLTGYNRQKSQAI